MKYLTSIERNEWYVVQNELKITMAEVTPTAKSRMSWSLDACFPSRLVKILKGRTIKTFFTFVRESAAKLGRCISDTKKGLTFIKTTYVIKKHS